MPRAVKSGHALPAPTPTLGRRSVKTQLKVVRPTKAPAELKSRVPVLPYTVIRDDREKKKKGWIWGQFPSNAGTVVQRLKTGDYTLKGYENVLCIERKGSVKELATNLHQKRFMESLKRMEQFPVKAVILEFDFADLTDWPKSSGLPPHKMPKHLSYPGCVLAAFWKVQMKFPTIPFIFAGNSGKEAASSLFKRVVEKYGRTIKKNST